MDKDTDADTDIDLDMEFVILAKYLNSAIVSIVPYVVFRTIWSRCRDVVLRGRTI